MNDSSSLTTPVSNPGSLSFLWRRSLADYPDRGWRYLYLGIVVLVTITLYYSLYIQYAVAPSIMAHFGMSFTYFLWISVVGNAVGAFASLIAGLGDRFGRANFTVYGLLVVVALLFALANAGSKTEFAAIVVAISFVEGIVLVSTPALIRDFSPQLGRASAMGFWTTGPVLGSLFVTLVTSLTLGVSTWHDEIRYAGVGGLVVFVIALFGLKELSPYLRDQIMVSVKDRELVEARAQDIDPNAESRHAWRDMLSPTVIGSAFAISVYLLFYYAAVGNLVIYFTMVFHYTEKLANTLANWYWASNVVALLVAGYLSDKLRVRKPFMLIGVLGSLVVSSLFALHATMPQTTFTYFAVLFVFAGFFGGFTYAPWMAGFTETVEARNPAATATGLAIWAWILRIVVSISAASLPLVVTSTTPLIEHGAQVVEAQQQAAPAMAIIKQHPELFQKLSQYPQGQVPDTLMAQAVREVGPKGLTTVHNAGPALATLQQYGPTVAKAAGSVAGQWQIWWWVCLGGQLVFLPFIFLMSGRWSSKAARADVAEHERAVAREMEALNQRQ